MSDQVRVRFAPSPTGALHIGGVRTALYNYLFAKKNKGVFLLRIEDTDQTRFVPGAEDYIIESLKWIGLEYDEGPDTLGDAGPYRQSERKSLYRKYAEQLVADGHAYYAFDTPEELDAMRDNLKKQGKPNAAYDAITRQYMKNSIALSHDEVQSRMNNNEPYVIRLKMPRNEEIKINDLIRGWVSFNSNQLDDKVLFKGDGMPTYHLANVVDDHLMKISHVIRGEEWLPSTPLHILLYRYLGLENTMPQFAHLPLILRPDGNGKLSKRDGDKLGMPVFPLDFDHPETGEHYSGFREKGFFPEAVINILAFLGWNPGTEQEIFSLDQLIEAFSIERIGKAGARFDFDKAKWFNQQYLKEESNAALAEMLTPLLVGRGYECSREYLENVVGLVKERVYFIPEILDEGYYFFEPVKSYDEKTVNKKWNGNLEPFFSRLRDNLNQLATFDSENIEASVKGLMEKEGLGFGQVLPIFRVMLCGTVAGPPIFEVAALMGREETVARMNRFLEKCHSYAT